MATTTCVDGCCAILHRRGLEYYEALLPAILGSLSGYVVSVLLGSLGLGPIFDFPPTPIIDQGQFGWALLAGVVAAGVATLFTYLVEGLRHAFGVVPLLASTFGIGGLVLVAGAKLTASAVAITSGWRGGFIIPLFLVGAALGRLGGQLFTGADEIVLVVALMAAINAGVTKTPLGSTIVVSELPVCWSCRPRCWPRSWPCCSRPAWA